MNQGNNNQNNNLNKNTGPSSKAPSTLNERPTNNKSGSFNANKSKGPSARSKAGKWTIDKAANLHPALKAAKLGLDAKEKSDNALNNIRAKKGPQGNPNANKSSDTAGGSSSSGMPRGSGIPKLIDLARPKVLDEIDEEEETTEKISLNPLSGVMGGNKSKTGVAFKAIGMIPFAKPIIISVVVAIFLIVFLILSIATITGGGRTSPLGILDSNDDYKVSKEEKEFKERVEEVQSNFSADGKTFDAKLIGAVYVVLNSYGKYDYDDMTTSLITDIANLMFDGSNTYSEDTFKDNLTNDFFPSKIKGKSKKTYERYTEEVFQLMKDYESQKKGTASSTGATGGACTYDIKGMNTEQYGTGIINQTFTASNIMVRLMSAGDMCGGVYGQSLNEELVPFEKYVLGVAYAEMESVGSQEVKEEAFKAQMIVARSYALAVPFTSYASTGRKLSQENGQWVLQIDNCVSTQVYCDPDIGCSKNVGEGNQNGVVYSGADKAAQMYKAPLPADHKFRQWAAEVAGKIPLDSQERLYMCNFQQAEQNQMQSLANSGYDYTQIVMGIYSNVKSISESNCTDVTTGDYRSWKQKGEEWSDIVLGGGTDSTKSIGSIGCLATSVAMLVAKSGALTMLPAPTLVTSDNFNPGTFVEAMNKSNGFDSGGIFQWNAVSSVIPKFKYQSSLKSSLSGLSKDNKFNTIKSKVTADNTYCVAEVKDGQGEHWVALDAIEGNTIKMLDPGSNATDLWKQYDWNRTSIIQCFTTN